MCNTQKRVKKGGSNYCEKVSKDQLKTPSKADSKSSEQELKSKTERENVNREVTRCGKNLVEGMAVRLEKQMGEAGKGIGTLRRLKVPLKG